MVPSLAYLTLLDEYIFYTWFFIILATFGGALVGKTARFLGFDTLDALDPDLDTSFDQEDADDASVLSRFRLLTAPAGGKGGKGRPPRRTHEGEGEPEDPGLAIVDEIIFWAMVWLFVVLHLYFAIRIRRVYAATQKLLEDEIKDMDESKEKPARTSAVFRMVFSLRRWLNNATSGVNRAYQRLTNRS